MSPGSVPSFGVMRGTGRFAFMIAKVVSMTQFSSSGSAAT